MDLAEKLEAMRDPDYGKSELGMNGYGDFKKRSSIKLKKDSYKFGSGQIYLYPLQIALPFNPFNPNDTTFNRDYKWIGKDSCETTVLLLKGAMRLDPELKEHICKKIKISPTSYDLTLAEGTADVLTQHDILAFKAYRDIVHYHQYVQEVTYSAYGDYHAKFLSRTRVSDSGEFITPKDSLYSLFEFENAVASNIATSIYARYDVGGIDAGKSDDDKAKELSLVWSSIPISAPYKQGALRAIKIPTNQEFEVDEKFLEGIKDPMKGARFFESKEVYTSGCTRETDKIKGFLGLKSDKFFNFVAMGTWNPEMDESKPESAFIDSYGSRTIVPYFPVDLAVQIPGLAAMYKPFRDDGDRFNEKVMLRSVKDWKVPSEDELFKACREDLGAEKRLQITALTMQNHTELLSKLDNVLLKELQMKAMSEILPNGTAPRSLKELASPDENVGTYGISVLNDAKDLNMSIDDEEDEDDEVVQTEPSKAGKKK